MSLKNPPSPSFSGFIYNLGDATDSKTLTWSNEQIVDYGSNLSSSVDCYFKLSLAYVKDGIVTKQNVDDSDIFVQSDTDKTLKVK